MCSPGDKRVHAMLAAAAFVTLAALPGCARPRGVLFPAIDPPCVFPPPPDTPRFALLGVFAGSDDLHAAESGSEVFKAALRGPRPPIKFSGPHGVAVGDGNRVAVADAAGGAVHILELDNRTHHTAIGFGDQRFAVPIGVAWVGDRLFVTDAERHEVIELDENAQFRGRFGGDALSRPVGICYVAQRDRLYVVDGSAHKVVIFDLSGRVTGSIGRRGSEPGAFNFPTHLAVSGERLLIADSGNFRVQLMDLDGRVIRTIGRKGDGAGDLSLPKGVAFDGEGHIYVVDAHFENVQVFDAEGRLLMALGHEGSGPGEFLLPAGLTMDAQDRLWVADAGNRRLQVFSYLRTGS